MKAHEWRQGAVRDQCLTHLTPSIDAVNPTTPVSQNRVLRGLYLFIYYYQFCLISLKYCVISEVDYLFSMAFLPWIFQILRILFYS